MRKISNKKLIIVFLALVVIFSVIVFFQSKQSSAFLGNAVRITIDGDVFAELSLDMAGDEGILFDLPTGNVVFIEHDGVSMHSADCPDQLCVKQGKAKGGLPIVCLPNKVAVELVSIEYVEIDAVTGR